MPNYYDILGVDKQTATDKDILKAFRKLAFKHHPDKPGGSHAKMQMLNAAYEALKNEKNRDEYDELWENSPEAADEDSESSGKQPVVI